MVFLLEEMALGGGEERDAFPRDVVDSYMP
jgi:hypothetical protein